MDDSESLKLALNFAKVKHKGQKRIGGDDYITHPIAVSEIVKNQGFDENYQITAFFHDLLEDTDATEEEILKYGNQKILEAVILLTKKKGYDMAEYINAIKQNPVAFANSKASCKLSLSVISIPPFVEVSVLPAFRLFPLFPKKSLRTLRFFQNHSFYL